MAEYQSRKKPIMLEFHAPEVKTGYGNYPTVSGYQPFSNKDNVDDIIDSCAKNFGKFKNTLTNTENQKIIEAAEEALNDGRKTKFSVQEKKELLALIQTKKKEKKH